MPKQFELSYMGTDNEEHTPYVVHRALLGSLERFIGIAIEHYGGAFPLWLAPVQVKVLPIAAAHHDAAHALMKRLREAEVRAEIDDRSETLGRRIRDAELEKVPLIAIWGDKESDDAIAVRRRGAGQETISLAALLAEIRDASPA
jgi:threonyl-tRNA synthetase